LIGYVISMALALCSVVLTFLSLLHQNTYVQFAGIATLVVGVGIVVYEQSIHKRQVQWLDTSAQHPVEDRAMQPAEEDTLPALALADRLAGILRRVEGERVNVEVARKDRCILEIYSDTDKLSSVAIVACNANAVGVSDVRGLHSLLSNSGAEHGLFFTYGTFTPQALKWAQGKSLYLVDGNGLDRLIARYEAEADQKQPVATSKEIV
jgi:hypothetical protein